MEENEGFRIVRKGYDTEEVDEYIHQLEEKYEREIDTLQKRVRQRDKTISALQQEIENKNREIDDVRKEYQPYMDNAQKITDLILETRIDMDRKRKDADEEVAKMRREAEEEVSKIRRDAGSEAQSALSSATAEAQRIRQEAEIEAKQRVVDVQHEIDARIEEGERRYVQIQDNFNEMTEKFNQMQKFFVRSYREIYQIGQGMPASPAQISVRYPKENLHGMDAPVDMERVLEEDDYARSVTGEDDEKPFGGRVIYADENEDEEETVSGQDVGPEVTEPESEEEAQEDMNEAPVAEQAERPDGAADDAEPAVEDDEDEDDDVEDTEEASPDDHQAEDDTEEPVKEEAPSSGEDNGNMYYPGNEDGDDDIRRRLGQIVFSDDESDNDLADNDESVGDYEE